MPHLTTSQLNTLNASTLGDLKPFQLEQVLDTLNRLNFDRGAPPSFTAQPTLTSIVTALGSNNP